MQFTSTTDGMITLDNGMLLKNLQLPDDIISQYKRIAANFSAKASGYLANAIVEAHLSMSFMNAKQNMINAWEQIFLCNKFRKSITGC